MVKGSKWIEASNRGSENGGLDPCKAHNVGISPQEDRGRPKSEMGEGEGGEEMSLSTS